MPELKKIDYRELSKEASKEAQEAKTLQGDEQPSFFTSLKNRWSLMDKKTKIETLLLVVVMAGIIAVAVYYFSNKRPEFNPEESYSPPAVENWQSVK